MTVEYLTENCDIVEKERSKWAEFNVTSKISPKADAEAKLTSTFTIRVEVIPSPDVAVVDAEHTLTPVTCCVCLKNVTSKSSSVDC